MALVAPPLPSPLTAPSINAADAIDIETASSPTSPSAAIKAALDGQDDEDALKAARAAAWAQEQQEQHQMNRRRSKSKSARKTSSKTARSLASFGASLLRSIPPHRRRDPNKQQQSLDDRPSASRSPSPQLDASPVTILIDNDTDGESTASSQPYTTAHHSLHRRSAPASLLPPPIMASTSAVTGSAATLALGSSATLPGTAAATLSAARVNILRQKSSSSTIYESDDENSVSSTPPIPKRKRSSKRRHASSSAYPLSTANHGDGDAAFNQSSSHLSVTSAIAQSLQNYRVKRHGTKEFDSNSYIDVFGETESYESRRDFMIDLTKAMASFGVPTHRLEYHLEAVGDSLGMQSTFIVFPGLVMMSFSGKKRSTETFFLKVQQGYHMGKLSQVNDLCFNLVHGSITTDTARTRLSDIRASMGVPLWTTFITFPVVSFGLCVVGFGGTWADSISAGLLSLVVAFLTAVTARFPSVAYLVEFLSALFVTALAKSVRLALQPYYDCLSTQKVVFSAIAILLPGLALTTSIIELSTRNMVSGTVRMFHAIFTAMLLGFGYAVGEAVTGSFALKTTPGCPAAPIALPWFILFFPPMAIGVCMTFEARRQQYPIMVAVQSLGFAISTLLPKISALSNNVQAITIVAAFAIGLSSNIYSRITRDVAIAPILGGILLLVPGSFGVRSTLGFISQDAMAGTTVAFEMLLIGLSITIGLFLSTLFVWPLSGPRMKYITV
ncbi:hypothetical protein BC831DRAFT_440944 [Entophlyctis helioformis]|nr:hypothetical protein BC831DRAFT_440944 [Entophlyctis helioformis]